jgi:ubiquitin
MKRKKKLTEIKNEIEDEEAKAHFIVNSLNQFYESHNNNIPGLFDSLSESF